MAGRPEGPSRFMSDSEAFPGRYSTTIPSSSAIIQPLGGDRLPR